MRVVAGGRGPGRAFDRFLQSRGGRSDDCAARMDKSTLDRARRLLCALQDEIQATLIAARAREGRRFARVAAVTAEDTIFHVDKLSEAAILVAVSLDALINRRLQRALQARRLR